MNTRQRLISLGLLLFLVSMLTGFAIPYFTNPRGALSAHLAAGMGGTLLIALGVAWADIGLTGTLEKAASWLAIYGCWGNWTWNVLNSIFGTHEATPIAGAGHVGAPEWQEKLILGLLGTAVLSITSSIAIMAWSAMKSAPASSTSAAPRAG